jgi:polyisoprenoid-binding protein YceI
MHPLMPSPLRNTLLCLTISLLAACQSLSDPQAVQTANKIASAPAADVPTSPPAAARYLLSASQTDIRLLVYRAGTLARLGHNHVVQATQARGEILLANDPHQSSFWVELPVSAFVVDTAAPRLDEGDAFHIQPDAAAITGTTLNMLGPLELDAEHYPLITIRSTALNGPLWGMDTTLRINLHGVERDMQVPVSVMLAGDQLIATAVFAIRQTDFGITPLSVFGGALSVEDTVRIRMRIVASLAHPTP